VVVVKSSVWNVMLCSLMKVSYDASIIISLAEID
jgi:hypothetical protein